MNAPKPPMLPNWLDADAAALSGAVAPASTIAAALPGLARAQSMTPMQRLQLVQQSGLAEWGSAGEPLHLAWRRFIRGQGPATLVIDATSFDARALGPAAVLERAPWLLAEGMLIAASLRDCHTIELRLPTELTGKEAPFLNATDTMRALANIAAAKRRFDIQRNCQPSCRAEPASDDASRLVHTPETWCRIALLFAAESALNPADLDASLLTLRRGIRQRGLVEVPRSGNLRQLIDGWGGGVEVQGDDPVLVFDDGLGGFLPLSQADLSCEPMAFAAAGIVPSPATMMVMAAGVCVVKQTRRALYRHWQLAEGETPAVRGLLARAARITTEITLGRGDAGHLAALDELALDLAAQGLAAAWPLASSLRHFRAQWEQHVRRESCPEGECLDLPNHAAPCHSTCPANIDIPSFMAHLGHGDYRATIEVIRRDNPLPLTCGLVCPAPCESACVRGSSDGAVFIRPLKAKAAEHCLANGGYPRPEIAPDSGKRIGIVGSGPAGLTAAYYLRTHGHQVEVFETQEHAGGMLRYGIPAYRLPPDLLEQELDQIRVLGIPIHTSAKIDRLEDFRKNYDAVFMGPGTQTARMLPIEGGHHPFVLGGIDFLRAVRSGEPVHVGPRVVVIGGGNVAIDVALTALRQGASSVDLVSLEKRRDMPASPHEIEAAAAEGVQLRGGWGPLRIDEEGVAVFQFCERVKDENGKFDPKFDTARLLTLEVDHVILATGQGTDLDLLEGSGVETVRGFITADPKTLMTNVPGVFAGGDGQRGPRTAVEAVRAGKIAAASIDAWLRGTPMDAMTGRPVRRAEVIPIVVDAQQRTYQRRAAMPEKDVEEVLGMGNYVRIEEGLSDAAAQTRCAAACAAMSASVAACAWRPAARWVWRHCAWVTPGPAAWPTLTSRALPRCASAVAPARRSARPARSASKTWTACAAPSSPARWCEQPLLKYADAALPTQTPAHRDFIRKRLPPHMASHLDREISPSSARLRGDRPGV